MYLPVQDILYSSQHCKQHNNSLSISNDIVSTKIYDKRD